MTRFSVAGRCFQCPNRGVLPDECDLGFNTFREVVSMKSLRLLSIALLACACTASAAFACDAHKTAKGTKSAHATTAAAKAAHAACTAEMAANCTPAMKAACESNAAVAAAMGCEAKGAAKGATSATAAAFTKSTKSSKSAKGGDCCAMKGASATTAAVAAMHGKASAAGDHCVTAKGTSATTAAAGMRCAAHASAVAHDCSACEDWTTCEQDVRSLGANAQVVPLKNGAMIVYTADSPANVKALQSVVAKRHDKMVTALAAGGSSKLCDECKQIRGAIASGKLHREVVNVERGCMTLITSNDQGVVQKIRTMTGQPVAMR